MSLCEWGWLGPTAVFLVDSIGIEGTKALDWISAFILDLLLNTSLPESLYIK